MSKWKFRKLESSHIRGVCVRCNLHPQKKVAGKDKYRSICTICDDDLYLSDLGQQKRKDRYKKYVKTTRKQGINYRRFKKEICEFCGFVPVHNCQLDVDHIDGNHQNNSEENLQTLCSNCHRLKSLLNKDGIYK